MIVAMMMQVSNITTIFDFFINTGAETAPPEGVGSVYTPEYDQYFKWLQLEICVFSACMFANMIFLAIRSCILQKITLITPNLLINMDTDYLESQQILLSMFVTFVVPVCYLSVLKYEFNNHSEGIDGDIPVNDNDIVIKVVNFQLPVAVVQSVAMAFMLFVSPWTPPRFLGKMSDTYATYMPMLMGVLLATTFVFIPLSIIIQTLI